MTNLLDRQLHALSLPGVRQPREMRCLVLLWRAWLCFVCFRFCTPLVPATAACGCLCLAAIRLPALCLSRDVLGDILGTMFRGKVLMADTLRWVVATWAEFATKTREGGHRIFHDIRGRQGAVGCGLGSSTVRLPHRAPSLYPQLVVL